MNTLDSRIANIDQLLTQDVEKFCSSVADLYTNVSKVYSAIFLFEPTILAIAIFGYYHLCTKIIRRDWSKWSIVISTLFSLFWSCFNPVRAKEEGVMRVFGIDYVVQLDV